MGGERCTLGFVTIGQAPRDDMVEEIMAIINKLHSEKKTAVFQFGALDDLGREEIAALAPRKQEKVLVTRLASGEVVEVCETRLEPYVQNAVERAGERADLVVLLCTGSFAQLHSCVPLVHPDRLFLHFCFSILTEGVLGVIVPDQAQIKQRGALWNQVRAERGAKVKLKIAAASPYGEDGAVARAGALLAGCDLVALDCMGYTAAWKESARAALGKGNYLVLARSVVALAIAELL